MTPIPPPTRRLREAWSQRPAFEVRGRRFSMWEVFQSAAVRGDLERAARTAEEAEAAATDQGREPDLAEVEALVNEFRYARGLESAEDTEAWLERRGLGADDLAAYAVRRQWRWLEAAAGAAPAWRVPESTGEPDGRDEPDLRENQPAAEDADEPAVEEEAETMSGDPGEGGEGEGDDEGEEWHVDLIFSGEYDRLARLLARQAALVLSASDDPAENAESPESALAESGPGAGGLAGWELETGRAPEWLAWAERYRRMLERILDPSERARLLAEQGWNLLQVELDLLEFDSEAAAREALLCVRDDHLSLAEVASNSGFVVRRWTGRVRDLPESWRTPLVCSAPGRVLGPLVARGLSCLVQIVSETEALAGDPAVTQELDRILEERAVAEVEMREVVWLLPPEVGA